jgi:Holliday junction resolvase RusA-like endonuclease
LKQLRLFIPVEPLQRGDPKGDILWIKRGGKNIPMVRLYQPTEYTKYKKLLAEIVYSAIVPSDLKGVMPLSCPLKVGFKFYISRTEVIGEVKKRGKILKPGKEIYHAKTHHAQKPDLSNLVKAAEDSLTGILWKDDALIVGHDPAPYKYWADNGQMPGIEVVISPCGAEEFTGKQVDMLEGIEA